MVIEIKPIEVDIDSKAMRVFLKSIEILGGPRKLVEMRNLTWLPSLMTASYAIIYAYDKHYTAEEIAKKLGATKQTIQNILRADPEAIKTKIEESLEEREEEKQTHTAGALAKLAYEEIKQGRDEINIALELTKATAKSLGADWAFHVLSQIKGTDFPVSKEMLLEKLKGLKIKEKPIEEILEKIEYPVHTPAELLHKIREVMEKT